jgi:hypothetical protein
MGTRPGIFAVDQGNGTPRQDTGIIESPDAVNRLIKRIGERVIVIGQSGHDRLGYES